MGDFEIELDDKTAPDYAISDNFAENLVDYSRSEFVGNEGQFLALNAAYASGLSRRPDEYLQIIVRGKSGEGKTELKQNVDKIYPNHWLLRVGSTSDMGLVDSGDIWDGAYIGAFAEFQQMQGKMLEMVKSCVDSDHNVVTPNGLVNIRKVNVGDEVLSWNPDTQEIEVKEVEETHAYEGSYPMVEVKNQHVHKNVTTDHDFWLTRGDGYVKEQSFEATEKSSFRFPHGDGISETEGDGIGEIDILDHYDGEYEIVDSGVRHPDPQHSTVPRYYDGETFLQLCAWIATEGSVESRETASSDSVRIAQQDTTEIEKLCDSLDIPYKTYSQTKRDNYDDVGIVRINNTVFEKAIENLVGKGSHNSHLPDFYLETEDRVGLLETLMIAEGNGKDTFSTVSERLTGQVVSLAWMCGFTPKVSPNGSGVNRVLIKENKQTVDTKPSTSDVSYNWTDDGVYCLTVEDNNTFIAGKNGKFSVTGNSAGDDADEDGVGFSHTRNVDDGDGGREADEIEKQAMPTVFLFADENNAEIPKELQTRQMVIRVESDKGLNKAVAKTMFDHNEVRVDNREYEYNFNFEDGVQAVKNHISNIPKPLDPLWDQDPKQYAYPVLIPYDEDIEWPINSHPEIDSMGWNVFKVVEDILNYEKTESKRGAKAIANHIRGHTRLNYHNRDTMDINGVTHYVADPQDVANVLSYRDLLLAITHDMNEQKLAVIDALTDEENGVGGVGPNGGLQAPHKDIREYIQDYADITEVSKSQLTGHGRQSNGILEDMEQDYLIEVHEGEGENGAHLYEFLGGSTFGHPNLDIYSELFEHCTDPIRDQPIADTVAEFKASLSVKTTDELLSDDPMNSIVGGGDDTESSTEGDKDDLSAFGGGSDESTVEYDKVDEAVHERLKETLDDNRITTEDIDALKTTHLLGASPTEMYTDDAGFNYIRAERPAENVDKAGTIFDPNDPMWPDLSDGQVLSRIENSIAKLRSNEIFEIHDDEDGVKYLVVHDIE